MSRSALQTAVFIEEVGLSTSLWSRRPIQWSGLQEGRKGNKEGKAYSVIIIHCINAIEVE